MYPSVVCVSRLCGGCERLLTGHSAPRIPPRLVGLPTMYDGSKAERDLGLEYRDVDEGIVVRVLSCSTPMLRLLPFFFLSFLSCFLSYFFVLTPGCRHRVGSGANAVNAVNAITSLPNPATAHDIALACGHCLSPLAGVRPKFC
mgnify:FL=1